MHWMLFFLLFPLTLLGQDKDKKWAVEVSGGALIGWWTHHKGSTDGGVKNNQGWDRTRTAPTLPVALDLLYRYHRWEFGLGANYSIYLEDDMIGSRHADNFYDKFPIGDPYVHFAKFNASVAYLIINKPKYSFGPQFRLGSFLIDTRHPQQDDFGFRFYWEAGLQNTISIPWFDIVVKPTYSAGYIFPQTSTVDHEWHELVAFGAIVGIRYWIK